MKKKRQYETVRNPEADLKWFDHRSKGLDGVQANIFAIWIEDVKQYGLMQEVATFTRNSFENDTDFPEGMSGNEKFISAMDAAMREWDM